MIFDPRGSQKSSPTRCFDLKNELSVESVLFYYEQDQKNGGSKRESYLIKYPCNSPHMELARWYELSNPFLWNFHCKREREINFSLLPIFECFANESEKFDFLIYCWIEMWEAFHWNMFLCRYVARGWRWTKEGKERSQKGITVHLFNNEIYRNAKDSSCGIFLHSCLCIGRSWKEEEKKNTSQQNLIWSWNSARKTPSNFYHQLGHNGAKDNKKNGWSNGGWAQAVSHKLNEIFFGFPFFSQHGHGNRGGKRERLQHITLLNDTFFGCFNRQTMYLRAKGRKKKRIREKIFMAVEKFLRLIKS